jgi:hypothetical protein
MMKALNSKHQITNESEAPNNKGMQLVADFKFKILMLTNWRLVDVDL